MPSLPPIIFSSQRRIAARRRMHGLQQRGDAARYIADDMAEDVLERLAFLRHEPARALIESISPARFRQLSQSAVAS